MRVDGKPPEHGIRLSFEVDWMAGFCLHVKNHVVREFACEHQRSAIGSKQERGLSRAQHLRRIDRAKRRRRSCSNRRQTNHDDRLGIAERWGIIQMQIEFILLGQRQRRNVLVLRRVGGRENPDHVNDRANVRTVVSAASGGRGADLGEEIR